MKLEDLKINFSQRKKEAFYASDTGKPMLDLYFGFTGEPVTNQANWWETLKWGAGRGVEEQLGIILKDSGIVDPNYNQKDNGRIDMKRGPKGKEIEIHGYIDFMTIDGVPIECKSINNANYFDVKKYTDGYPRENYVGQLSIYMDYLGKDVGYLFVASVDGLERFLFPCRRIHDRVYQCGNTIVDLDKIYIRWSNLYYENILKNSLPDIFEVRYKYDVSTLDWRAQSQSAISNARNGHAVIGDFEVKYSPWKDKIVALQGTPLGYTNEELTIILDKTKGYTTWFKRGKVEPVA